MYKLRFFRGNDLELHWNMSWRRIITTAKRDPNVYQILKSETDEVVWQRKGEQK